ncbi:MAG: hypothetical protein ACT4TC_13670 [Myxococcaceae bacterium]
MRFPFYALRLLLLLLVLAGSALWGLKIWRGRSARTDWTRTLQVGVTLVSERPISPATEQAWRAGLEELGRWMEGEAKRYGQSERSPVTFHLEGPHVQSQLPSLELPEDRIQHLLEAWRLSRELNQIEKGVPNRYAWADARIFVTLENTSADQLSVEGLGAEGGSIGLVRASLADEDLTLSLTAVAHELLHCLGASDKYDEAGHAQLPHGLVAPAQNPLFPQPAAEVMVGEVSLQPNTGRLPQSLSEVKIGPTTAREIHWVQ